MKSTCILIVFLLAATFCQAQQSSTIDNAKLLDYYQSQRYADALQYLKSAYAEPITDKAGLSALAYTSQMAGKLADAENYYQRVYNMDTTNLSVLNSMAGINMRRGNQDRAFNYYIKITQQDSSNFYVYTQLARISAHRFDSLGRITYLKRANVLNGDDPDVASDLSTMYIRAKVFDQAEKVLSKAIVSDSTNVILLQSLENLDHAQKKWPETVKVGNQLLSQGDYTYTTVTKLAQAYYYLKNYQCCIETLADMPGIQQNENSYYWTAMAYKHLKDYNHAIVYLNKAIKDGISTSISTYYGEMGENYQEKKQLNKSLTAYQKGLEFEDSRLIYYSLANLYDSDLKNKAMAVKYFKKYLSSNPPAKEQNLVVYTKGRLAQLNGLNDSSAGQRTSQ